MESTNISQALSLLLLIAFSNVAIANDALVLKCRSFDEPAKRLECYDAMPVSGSPGIKTPPTRLLQQGTEPETKVESFGRNKQHATDELMELETTIPGNFYGWSAREQIKLSNGQIWQVVDDSNGAFDMNNPKVKIRRGLFGSFFLEIEGTNKSPKVKRLN